ncbi:MAG: prepilin-type N-terminal cleavage/methylation domain-containing protein [bacterium]|nr:prepilin-type N-terminal cleavage/methylation domain-containing protein [bacterium]
MQKLKRYKRIETSKSGAGFTLIEAVVATAVFAFVVSSILGVYMATLQIDGKTKAQREVTRNSRFIMEFLAKEVRNGTINYSAYSGGDASTSNELYIINQLDEIERVYLSGENLVLGKAAGTTNLNSTGVRVIDVKFLVSPIVDPLTSAKNANQQPNVTVILTLRSNYGDRAADVAEINIQSTFTVRSYPSRL